MIVARSEIPGQPLRLVDVPIPSLKDGELLIRIKACGVCHSDLHIVDGDWSNEGFPKVPGHEIAGVVAAVSPGVKEVQVGDRVGLPWIHATCGQCAACEKGDTPLCPDKTVTGLTVQGGFGEFIKAPARSVTRIPDQISFEMAAPLFCAGLTSYSAFKLAEVRPGERVAVHGVGGLGHLAIQLAKCLGAQVIALTSAAGKVEACRQLGADHCVVGNSEMHAATLRDMGGADVILSTVPDPSTVAPLVSALAGNGRMVIVGAGAGSVSIRPKDLIHRRLRIMGSPVGTNADMRHLLDLVVEKNIKVEVSIYSLSEVNEALADLRSGVTRFRVVLVP